MWMISSGSSFVIGLRLCKSMVMVGLNIIMIFKNIIWLMIDLFSVKLILYLYITVYYTNKVNTTHYSYLIALSHIRLMPSDASPN